MSIRDSDRNSTIGKVKAKAKLIAEWVLVVNTIAEAISVNEYAIKFTKRRNEEKELTSLPTAQRGTI